MACLLEQAQALLRGPDYPAIEWEGRWIAWDEMSRSAERIAALLGKAGLVPDLKYRVAG